MVIKLQAIAWLQHCIFMSRLCLFLCRDKGFRVVARTTTTSYTFRVATCLVLVEISLSRQSTFVSKQSLVKARSFYVATEYFYVVTKFGLGYGFYVATEYFCVVTEYGKGKEFLCHDIVFLCRYRV